MADPLEGLPTDHKTWTPEQRRIYRERLEDQKFENLEEAGEPTTEYGDMDEDFNPLPPSADLDLEELRADVDRLKSDVNETLELDMPSLDPAVARDLLQRLRAAEAHLEGLVSGLGDAAAIRDALRIQLGYTQLITDSNLAHAQDAVAVQKTLITFSSMLFDLASVMDFLKKQNLEELRDSSGLEQFDSAYEFLKDFESLSNTLSDQLDLDGSLLVNDLGGLMPEADAFWGNDPRTAIGTLKSHASDLAGILDDIRAGKKIPAKSVGQLIGRIAKSIAEMQMAEREAVIDQLSADQAAEQKVTGGVFEEYGAFVEHGFVARSALKSVRSLRLALTRLTLEVQPAAAASDPVDAPAEGRPGERVAHFEDLVRADHGEIGSLGERLALGTAAEGAGCLDCAVEEQRLRDAQDFLDRMRLEHQAKPKPQRVLDGAREDRDKARRELRRCRSGFCSSSGAGCGAFDQEIAGSRDALQSFGQEVERLELFEQEAVRVRDRISFLETRRADVSRERARVLKMKESMLTSRIGDKFGHQWLEEFDDLTAEMNDLDRQASDLEEQATQLDEVRSQQRQVRRGVVHLQELKDRCLAPNIPQDDLSDAARALAARIEAPPQEPPRADDDERGEGSRLVGCLPWLIGLVMLGIGGGLVAFLLLGGGSDDDALTSGSDTAPNVTARPSSQPEQPPPATETTQPATVEEASGTEEVGFDPRDLGIPLVFVPLGDGNSIAFFEDADGGISWSILNADGEILDPSQVIATWVVRAVLTQPWLDAAVNFSSFPCGAVTDEFRVTCPLGAGPLEEGEYFIIGAQLEGQVADGDAAFTYGLAFDDDDDEDDNYQFAPPFDADFFRNTEHWYRLHIAADGTRSMWADGARDGVLGLPKASSAAVIEWDDTIIWLIPRTEVPGDSPAYRVTAFHNRGVPGAVPVPDNSGGDVSGLTVTEPLIAIDGEFVEFSDLSTLPPDIPDPLPRLPIELPPDEHITAALVDDFMTRAEAATASGDPEQVFGLVLPELLAGETGDTCRADMEASIVLADGLTLVEAPSGPDTSQGFPFYVVETTIDYSTGSVPYPAVLAASNVDGRLYLLLPSCLG